MTNKDSISRNLLDRMLVSLKHEDFYQTEKFIDPKIALGRIHLGIFNPEPQPIFNDDKSLIIVFDGKIYDYKSELQVLKNRGYKFRFENDAEFCLYSYVEYGIKFIKNLNGNFVLAIYDFKKDQLIVANDRFGLRIHYYALINGTLLIAPEIKAILQDNTYKKELNEDAIASFFAFGEFWSGLTFFKNIQYLPPATVLIYDRNKLILEKYWEPLYDPDYSLSIENVAEKLVKEFKKAVNIRMKDKMSYGISLSGGLDSRAILAGISIENKNKTLTYTFGPNDCDEVKIASKAAKKTEVENFKFDITPDLVIQNSKKAIRLVDGINYLGVSFLYFISKSIKNRVDIAFDGFALDLTLGGSYLSKKVLQCKSLNKLQYILYRKRLFNDEEFSKLFKFSYYDKIKDIPLELFNNEFNKIKYKTKNFGNLCDLFHINTRLAWFPVGYILTRDFFEMSHPTADNNFFEFILKIPPELRSNHLIYRQFLMKLSPELSKIPYNSTMVNPSSPIWMWKLGKRFLVFKLVLKKLIWRYTRGKIFLKDKRRYVNFEEWFRTNTNWYNYFQSLLMDEECLYKNFINQEYVKGLLSKIRKGKRLRMRHFANQIVFLASFELFLRIFFNSETSK
ncbi:MAG: asparagine synthetase B family protein [Candidatus Hodarchaeota archaeon]